MKREPVGETLVLDQAVQPRLPAVAEVGVLDREVLRAAREDRDAVTANRAALDGDVPAAVHTDCDAARAAGIRCGVGPFDRRIVEVERDVVAADDDQGGIERRGGADPIPPLRDRRGFRDDHAAPQRNRRAAALPLPHPRTPRPPPQHFARRTLSGRNFGLPRVVKKPKMPYLLPMTYAAITGWGACMPPAVLTNADLATFLDTSDEWIVSRTGMKERRVSHVSAIELSTVAAARALACANLPASDVDLIIYGSCSYDEAVPNCASGVQLNLGATHAAAMDVNTACTSFLYGLITAHRDDPHRRREERRRDRRRVDHPLHGLEQPQRRGAVRRRRGRGRAAGVGEGVRRDRQRHRLRRGGAAVAAGARNRVRLRGPGHHARRHDLGFRRPGHLQARREGHERRVGARDAGMRRHRRTRSTSSCRTRRTCASSSRSRSTPAFRWSA